MRIQNMKNIENNKSQNIKIEKTKHEILKCHNIKTARITKISENT